MKQTLTTIQERSQPRLRAMIEITNDGELKIWPIVDSDADEQRILEALLPLRGASPKGETSVA